MDQLLGIAPGTALHELRQQRAVVVRHMQASDDAILRPANQAGFTHAERAAVALRIANKIGDANLASHYRNALEQIEPGSKLTAIVQDAGTSKADARFATILAHADRLTVDPDAARPEHLAALSAAGLSDRAILGLSQVVAYVNYQARVLAGLRMLGGQS
jgi:CMD domain protein